MGNLHDGIVLLDKNDGETSFEVVKKVRRILKIKNVGHAGTLEPFATGLLVVLLGQGTKLCPYLLSARKKYLATLTLGAETDTQDRTGRILWKRPVSEIRPERIKEKALGFVGEVEQIPPIFSAVKHRGKRAYEFAREGIKIQLKKRKVKIYSLDVMSVNLPDVTIEVVCSRGTYIRTLAADLGKELGCGAYLRALRRLSIGSFDLEDALNLKNDGSGASYDELHDKVIPLRESLPHMNEIEVDAQMARRLRHGYQPERGELILSNHFPDSCEGYVKVVQGPELVTILKVHSSLGNHGGRLEIMRVFN
jgi:tRNA pseudouridine55 synthase